MKFFRKLYDWVLHWAETPFGGYALFILAFAESSFFSVPPDPLLIALILGVQAKAFKYAINCTIGSVSGAVFGYIIGYSLWWTKEHSFSSMAMFFFNNIPGFTQELFYGTKILYEKWDFWIIFTAAFTPIPFKIFTITGGAFNINLFMFILASLIGRGGRFFIVAFLIWKYDKSIKSFIDKYFNILAILFTILILLIGGFILIKYLTYLY